MIKKYQDMILKAAKSSGASKAEIIYGSLFVTFTPGFVDVLSNELKGVLEKLLKTPPLKCILYLIMNTLTISFKAL